MFGAVFGDIIGSYYEMEQTKEYNFIFHPESEFTDDTVLNTAVCKAILYNSCNINRFALKKRAREYAMQYKHYYSCYPSAGYGKLFSLWATDREFKRIPSYGNGAAMRAVPIGYAYDTLKQVLLQAKASCIYTHNNAEAIRGAQAVASAVFFGKNGATKDAIKGFVEHKFGYDLSSTVDDIRSNYTFEIRCDKSVPQALVAFFESTDYESAVRNAVSLGGDADTLATIAGGIAEAYYKHIPKEIETFCMSRIDATIKDVIKEFVKTFC